MASVVNDLKLYGFLNLLAEVTIAFHPDGEGGDETFLLWESVLKSIQENSLDFGQCLLDFLKLTGFAMNFSTCLECKSTLFSTPIVFDPERGGVLCGACVSHKVVSQWQIREEHNTEKLCSDDVVRVLCLAIERQLQRPLKSYAFLKAFLQQAA
ncbi:MAG: DNA repair protein RecO C-terminal domain-containing protein [Deltaproteobacteria bacterium]|nr:DNA repair protein RecO C-terminal domain-containing protein [Deltaproteobacteria bacterium]